MQLCTMFNINMSMECLKLALCSHYMFLWVCMYTETRHLCCQFMLVHIYTYPPLHIPQHIIINFDNLLQPPWLSPDVTKNFLYDECKETRTWEQVASEGKAAASTQNFKTGGLDIVSHGLKQVWGVWACWKDHPCLQKLMNSVDGDYMCFVYNELEEAWYPWGIKREVQQRTCPESFG
jgi:hypothetical protein